MSSRGTQRFSTLKQRLLLVLTAVLRPPSPVDQPNRSWAQLVSSWAQLPETLRTFVEALPADEREPFPYAVLTPTFKGIGRASEKQKLAIATPERIYIFEARESGFDFACFPLQDLCCIEVGTILLHSWITIHGSIDGLLRSATLRFNSISENIMLPIVQRMRPACTPIPGVDLGLERARFDHLAQTNFKFMSYAQKTLRPGTRVRGLCLQPRIRGTSWGIWRLRFARPISPAHLTILSDTELIGIRDDETQRWMKGSPHGAIWTYIPRSKIQSSALIPRGDRLLTLSVELAGGLRVQSVFEADQQHDLHQLLQQIGAHHLPS